MNNTLGQLSENFQRGNETLNNSFGQLSQNLQQGNENLDNTLGRLSADMRRGNLNVTDNLAQLVENTRRRNLDPENQEALQIINDPNTRPLTEDQVQEALDAAAIEAERRKPRAIMPTTPGTPRTPFSLPEYENIYDFIE